MPTDIRNAHHDQIVYAIDFFVLFPYAWTKEPLIDLGLAAVSLDGYLASSAVNRFNPEVDIMASTAASLPVPG